jgi:glycosyltransferase involved in cell wall biosynthesis
VKRKLKIAIVSDIPYPWITGGAQLRTQKLYEGLIKYLEIYWICMKPRGINQSSIVYNGICYEFLNPIPDNLYNDDNSRKILPAILFTIYLFLFLLRNRFDYIDSNEFPFLHNFPLFFLKLFFKYKLFITWHEIWTLEYWQNYIGNLLGLVGYAIQLTCLHLSTHIIANSSFTKQKILALNEKKKVNIITPGISSESLYLNQQKKNIVLYVGRLIPEKNVHTIIGAAYELKHSCNHIKFLIVGNGPEKERLFREIQKYKLNNVIINSKTMNHQEILKLMAEALIFVSMSEREGFGMTVLEALVSNCFVIINSHHENGARFLVSNKVKGYRVENSPKKLAKLIEKIVLYGEIPQNQHKLFHNYEWKVICKKLSSTLVNN